MRYVVVLVRHTSPYVRTETRDIETLQEAARRVAADAEEYDWFFIMETTTWSIVASGEPSAVTIPAPAPQDV